MEVRGKIIPNKVYDFLKYVMLIAVPTLISFVSTLGIIWQWNITCQITATIGAVGMLIGGLLCISTKNYNDAIIQDPPNGTDDEEVVAEDEEGSDE